MISVRGLPLAYTTQMRLALIALFIVLIAWTGTDALVCPDGCADTPAGSLASPAHSSIGCCILCHGGFTLDLFSPDLSGGPSARRPVIFAAAGATPPPPAGIEHPPRNA
jgi:hypothetical protein